MEQQIIQFNRIIHSETYKKAEREYNGIKHGEYYRLLKQAQRLFVNANLKFTSFIGKLKNQRLSQPAEYTTKAN